ncbi:hypothetical protein SIID45300_02406 [Candidatus Magnetaquicoccaceae bacterium FCR-1]|uniref:Bro-N domain-containing protein n=1 Tax=Candidatus Magnetaquiglobus chichijimensis TaxID=3141448 RepID=A0ABQ0CAZ5_9PROT
MINPTHASSTYLTLFEFETHPIRIVTRDGDPWFVAADVCRVLEIRNTSDAIKRLDADEQALDFIEGISRGNDQVNIINESGLYSLVMRSYKPQAKPFRKWVTGTVLPSIRKTGSYQHPSMGPIRAGDEDCYVQPGFAVVEGRVVISSVDLAVKFGKRHETILRTIRNLDCSPEFRRRHIFEGIREFEVCGTPYREPICHLSRDGFLFLFMRGYIGKHAQLMEAYLDAFDKQAVASVLPSTPPSPPQTLPSTPRPIGVTDPMLKLMEKLVSAVEILAKNSIVTPEAIDRAQQFELFQLRRQGRVSCG